MKQAVIVILTVLMFGVGSVQSAQHWLFQDKRPVMLAEGPSQSVGEVSLDTAVQQVKSSTGGRVLSAKTINKQGRQVHQIKVLTKDKKVRTISVDKNRNQNNRNTNNSSASTEAYPNREKGNSVKPTRSKKSVRKNDGRRHLEKDGNGKKGKRKR